MKHTITLLALLIASFSELRAEATLYAPTWANIAPSGVEMTTSNPTP